MTIFFRIIAVITLAAASLWGAAGNITAQTPVSSKERDKIVKGVMEPWNDWETMSISGKLKMAGLSLNPSLKIYMEKDSLIRISLRVPLMGEVGRAEIEGDSILVVNKMKKAYVKESLNELLTNYPVTLGDLQSLLLGRIALPGMGQLTTETVKSVDIYPDDTDKYFLMPTEEYELDAFQYAYLIDSDLLMTSLMVIPEDKPDVYVNTAYQYDNNGYEIIVTYQSPEKIYGGNLLLDNPTEGGAPIEPIKLSNKYRKVTFQQFMRSF